MRFLADENFPLASVWRLREAGHDALAAAELMPGKKDEQVLSFATRDSRILLTFDRDYGELIYRQGKPAPLGVVHLRFVPADPYQPADIVLGLNQVEGYGWKDGTQWSILPGSANVLCLDPRYAPKGIRM